MYIKDDLIIPHSYKFYDLIVTKSRGKSGWEMFKRLGSRDKEIVNRKNVVDKDGGHPGKVITRSWYDRNKHIFPPRRRENVFIPIVPRPRNHFARMTAIFIHHIFAIHNLLIPRSQTFEHFPARFPSRFGHD
jgi:hypothetical protein